MRNTKHLQAKVIESMAKLHNRNIYEDALNVLARIEKAQLNRHERRLLMKISKQN